MKLDNLKNLYNSRSKLCLYFDTVGIKTCASSREKTHFGNEVDEHFKSADSQHSKPKVNKEEMAIINRIKRYNWETLNLFGPSLQTESLRKFKPKNEVVDKNVEEVECSGVLSTGEKNIKVNIWETGYDEYGKSKIVNANQKLNSIKVKDALIEFRRFQPKKENLKTDKEVVKDIANSITTTPSDLKLTDSVKTLKSVPLCGSNTEVYEACLISYCQNILGIANPSELYPASVTQILQKTMSEQSRFVLEKWENKMILKLGFQGFQKYKQELFSVGRLLHGHIENYYMEKFLGLEKIEDSVKGFWKSVQHVFKDITDVQLMETKVNHSLLGYKGVVDCIGNYRGVEAVIEWKTSQRPKISLVDLYDNPLQVAAYTGAINHSKSRKNQISRGVVVIAYSSGAPAHLHYLNEELMDQYWNQWLERLEKYFRLCYSVKS